MSNDNNSHNNGVEVISNTNQDNTNKRSKGRQPGFKPDPKQYKKAEITLRDRNILDLKHRGLNNNQISKALAISNPTVSKVLKKYEDIFTELSNIDNYEQVRDKLFSATELRLLKSLNDENKIKDATLSQVSSAFDKVRTGRRLEQGLSTANNATEIRYTSVSSDTLDTDES